MHDNALSEFAEITKKITERKTLLKVNRFIVALGGHEYFSSASKRLISIYLRWMKDFEKYIIALSKEETWEESELYNYLAPTKFMFVIFQERGDGAYVFDRVMFWNIPNDDLEEVHRVWERTVQTIRSDFCVNICKRCFRTFLKTLSNIVLIKIAYPRKIRKNIKDLRKSIFQIVRLYSQKICAIMLVETYLTEINDIHQCSPPGAFINKSRMGIHPHGCLSGIKAYR